MRPRTGAIVQARMGSTRLPGKVLEPIGGVSMLARVVQRLRSCRRVEVVVIAVPRGPSSATLLCECRALGVDTWEGPEHDVLTRYLEAADAFSVDPVVRVTSDCPLIDPGLVDRTVDEYHRLRKEGFDLVSNIAPRRWPRGLDTEVVSREALLRASELEDDPAVREHVTLALYRRPDRFRVGGLDSPRDLSGHRWTVDAPEDLAFVRAVYQALGGDEPPFGMAAVLDLLARRPELREINAAVAQKELPR